MHFHDILDENKLADALWKLIDRPGWRKIGARLRLNARLAPLTKLQAKYITF